MPHSLECRENMKLQLVVGASSGGWFRFLEVYRLTGLLVVICLATEPFDVVPGVGWFFARCSLMFCVYLNLDLSHLTISCSMHSLSMLHKLRLQ